MGCSASDIFQRQMMTGTVSRFGLKTNAFTPKSNSLFAQQIAAKERAQINTPVSARKRRTSY